MPTCTKCGDTVSSLNFDKNSGMCIACKNDTNSGGSTKATTKSNEHRRVIVTTAMTIPHREILDVVEVISAESAIGVNLFRDIAGSLRDVFGGRSSSLQRLLREARHTCLDELRREAHSIGAHAVVAIDLDYSEYSSNLVSGGMLLVVATGTAVKLAPLTQ